MELILSRSYNFQMA